MLSVGMREAPHDDIDSDLLLFPGERTRELIDASSLSRERSESMNYSQAGPPRKMAFSRITLNNATGQPRLRTMNRNV